MKIKVRLLFLLLLVSFSSAAQNRPKVAVVLSGGGAKGTAHIGALKVIEEAGIPIDCVVGTSMGAIVGGLYAIGYTPMQLDSMVNAQNWRFLLSDKPNPKDVLLDDRLRSERYVLSVPFSLKSVDISDAGIIKGRNIAILFSALTEAYRDSVHFDALPIPFACVSENLVNGGEVVFHEGILATAMRSSMSIPGVFAPVNLNGMVLVDGGMVNNYPVDVALAMGADYVIGVDVQSPLLDARELKSMKDVFGQILNLQGERKYRENLKKTDVHIKVDVSGYSAASFNKEAIDTLVARGERAARANWNELLEVKRALGLPADYRPERPGPYLVSHTAEEGRVEVDSQIAVPAIQENRLNFGIRFDTEELAALQANTDFYLGKRQQSLAALTIRLGRRTLARLGYDYRWGNGWQAGGAYQFSYKDINLYNAGKRTLDITFTHQLLRLGVAKDWSKLQIGAGMDFEYYRYHDLISLEPLQAEKFKDEALFSYYVGVVYNSLNSRSMPTRGMSWSAGYRLYTDNLFRYRDDVPVSALAAHWKGCFGLTGSLTFMPYVAVRLLSGSDGYPFSIGNLLGGNLPARYMPQQIAFVGVKRAELAPAALLVGGVELRQHLLKRHYASLVGNYGRTSDKPRRLLKTNNADNLAGVGIGYMYNSILGPLEFQLNWSTQTKQLGWYASFGFVF